MRRLTVVAAAITLLCLVAACSSQEPPILPDSPNLRVGIAPFTQPEGISDLIAGYVSDTAPRIEPKVFPLLDNEFADLLAEMTERGYVGLDKSRECMQLTPKRPNSAAFDYWLTIGKCMNVDVLIVPQIHTWQERQGGEMGSEYPAAIAVDFFMLDINGRALLARSRYDEKQRALLENLMDVGKFIERKGRWVDAATLAREGMFKAIKDFGL